ncbi:MAG: transketolase [Chloroflexi bacterium]|nr:transketolase [Chloroflexota bacterium]
MTRVYPHGSPHCADMIADLSRRAYEYRIQVLNMVYAHQTGHIGGAFSIAEALVALYFHHLRIDPQQPQWPDRDRLVFSKGHACAMLYTVLAHRGFFPVAELATFRELNSHLQGHPERQKTPGVEVPAGPLGHGVAIGAGMALAARMDRSRRRTYAILGDGEINAGVVWEGALVAAKYQLDNLTVILDYNGVQQTGTTAQVLSTEPITAKWAAFGWHVIEIHGHNMAQMLDALDQADEVHAKPVIIIARTTKGKGVSFMENNPYWHGNPPTEPQFQAALAELREGAAKWQN